MIDKKESENMLINNLIEQEMKEYFGNTYYDEFTRNSVTYEQFTKLQGLVFRCIDIYKNNK